MYENIPSFPISKETEITRWSDIVAGRHPNVAGTIPATAQRFDTIITSRSIDYYRNLHEAKAKTNRTTHLQATNKEHHEPPGWKATNRHSK